MFADAHHDTLTGNMKAVYQSLVHKDYDIAIYCQDIQKMSAKDMLKFMKQFMQAYAQAEYVFINSYFCRFHPVGNAKKQQLYSFGILAA